MYLLQSFHIAQQQGSEWEAWHQGGECEGKGQYQKNSYIEKSLFPHMLLLKQQLLKINQQKNQLNRNNISKGTNVIVPNHRN